MKWKKPEDKNIFSFNNKLWVVLTISKSCKNHPVLETTSKKFINQYSHCQKRKFEKLQISLYFYPLISGQVMDHWLGGIESADLKSLPQFCYSDKHYGGFPIKPSNSSISLYWMQPLSHLSLSFFLMASFSLSPPHSPFVVGWKSITCFLFVYLWL